MGTTIVTGPDRGTWRDRKRRGWMLSVVYPLMPFSGIAAHAATGREIALALPLVISYGLLPLLDALIGRTPGNGADVFHGTLAAALVDWTMPALERRKLSVVALGGGCLMNRVLTELLSHGFEARGVKVLLPRKVPANDGGLSLGQARVAALQLMG